MYPETSVVGNNFMSKRTMRLICSFQLSLKSFLFVCYIVLYSKIIQNPDYIPHTFQCFHKKKSREGAGVECIHLKLVPKAANTERRNTLEIQNKTCK